MKTIYKYHLNPATITEIAASTADRVVRVAMQHGEPTLWMEAYPLKTIESIRKYKIYVTGANIPDKDKYIGTFEDGAYILHVYEVVE